MKPITIKQLYKECKKQIDKGNGNKIIKQYPAKGNVVTNKENVFLITNDSNSLVPDVIGLSSKDAKNVLELYGIKVRLEGTGYVAAQSVGANTQVTDGMEISLLLSPKFTE